MQNESATTINFATGEISDHQLLDLYISNRTPGAFLELVRRHSGLVYGTCLRITGNHQDAEDLTQECFFDLVRQAGQIRTSLAGWLHQAATNQAFNRLRGERRRKNREREAAERIYLTAELPLAEVTWNEIEPLIDRVLSEIPEHLRVPILLHYLEGATQSDIANDLGVHQSTVSRRLSDGLDFLRERLRQFGFVVPTTILLAWLTSQTAVAAPSSLFPSLGKIALAGIGTANSAGTSQIAWLTGVAKGVAATLLLPVVAGIVWGELIFLFILALCCSYLGIRRPEWFRVLCFTRQFPNIYEWHFFPFKRWTWRKPPREWRIWMAASFVIGIELLGLAVLSPFYFALRQGTILLVVAGTWNIFVGVRIWQHVRNCCSDDADQHSEREYPVDGALLVTLASASTVILQYGEQSAILNIANDATGRMAATGVIAMVHIMPGEFQKGIPQSLNLKLAIIDPIGRQNQVEGVQLAVPSQLTLEEWRSQFELLELVAERSILLGETVNLGTVQGNSLTLRVLSNESKF